MTSRPDQAVVYVQLPALHPGQMEVYHCPARFIVICAGRRWGKTYLGCVRCLETALQGGYAWWVAPTYIISDIGWNLLSRLAGQLPGVRKNESDRWLRFDSGGYVRVRTASEPDYLRGEGLNLVVLDECAIMEEAVWNESLRPALADKQGKAIFISTPKGQNWFYRLFVYAQSSKDPEWAAFHFPTDTNPYIPLKEIRQAQQDMPAIAFAQEFGAQFIAEGTNVFPTPQLVSPSEQPVPPFFIGADWAISQDFTVFCVLDAEGKLVAMERYQKVSFGDQLDYLYRLCQEYPPASITAERNAVGERLVEEIYQRGYHVRPIRVDLASKAKLIQSLALALEQGRIRVRPFPDLLAELASFQVLRISSSGVPVYGAPEGAHDDCVMALAMAYDGLSHSGSLFLWGER